MQVTRQRIVDYLYTQKHATVGQLTAVIGLTPMAVRHHLNVLIERGLVEVCKTRRTNRPGRPVQIYALTEQARHDQPQHYLQLSDLLMDEMVLQLEADKVEAVIGRIAERIGQLAPPCLDSDTFETRLDTAVSFLRRQGFATRWSVEDDQYVLHHEACPYQHLAERHQAVCLLDERLIGSMLRVKPIRTDCMADNDAQCRFCLGVSTADTVLPDSAN